MKNVKKILLLVITIVLVVELLWSHLWPAIYLRSYKQEYHDSALACLRARDSYNENQRISKKLEESLKWKLIAASEVELVRCYEHDLLKNKLLSNGVERSALRVIFLEALSGKGVSLESLIGPYK